MKDYLRNMSFITSSFSPIRSFTDTLRGFGTGSKRRTRSAHPHFYAAPAKDTLATERAIALHQTMAR